MRIALFIKNGNIDAIHILVFDAQVDKILNSEDCFLYEKDINYVSLWLISKQVKAFYIRDADDKIRNYFHKLDIEVKTYEDIPNINQGLFEAGLNLMSDKLYHLQSKADFYRILRWMD